MSPPLAWHQALAYLVTGARLPVLGRQDGPVPATLTKTLTELEATGQVILDTAPGRRHTVPADLMSGIGPAQFWAAQAELVGLLDARRSPLPSPVLQNRALTAEERRLVEDAPPHHGS